MKRILVLGSTGSIGQQTLDIIEKHPESFQVIGLSAGENSDLLRQQIQKHNPNVVSLGNPEKALELQKEFPHVKVLVGTEGIEEMVTSNTYDLLVNALRGFVGVKPTLIALEKGKTIGLAHKESLVCAGSLIQKMLKKHGGKILPFDSEHSALFQCLQGEKVEQVEKLIITCSGGPFYKLSREEMRGVKLSEALKHPTWNMGRHITIGSANLINKGLEVIEAMYLFDLPVEKIEVVIHPQSCVHGLIQFQDGNIMAQINPPDMHFPIHYALFYPERPKSDLPHLNLLEQNWHFSKPDLERFPCLALAYQAAAQGGNAPAAFQAAQETAIQLFLEEKISFLDMEKIIREALTSSPSIADPSFDEIISTDQAVKIYIKDILLPSFS